MAREGSGVVFGVLYVLAALSYKRPLQANVKRQDI